MISFQETGLQTGILDAVQDLGFDEPTPIQAKTIPHLLTSGRDLIAFAQTGTGKTAAFGLPAIQLADVEDKNTQTLVLCPTRELCMQITRDLTSYSKNIKKLNIAAVYGGANIETQIKSLNKGAQIVVATPGRAKDLIKRRKLQLGNVERVVLDEADEMLTMGFKEDLNAILEQTPEEKQTLLFSATMSKEIVSITKKYMHDPVELSAARKNTGADHVTHQYYMVHARDRYEVLKRIADMNPDIYGIVFCRTRRETKEIANKLMQDGYNADALHGDLSQAQRDEVMGRFRKRHLQILVATDVAARGLDVSDLTHVINFDLPDDAEIYIHRSGRTGRAGKSGISIAIIHTREMRKVKEIEKKFSVSFTKALVPTGKEICSKQLFALIDKMEKVEVDENQIEPFLPDIYKKLEWLSREELIKHFVSLEFNRFLAYYKHARDINVAEGNGLRERGPERGKKRNKSNVSFSRLYINAGSKNGLTPARLIGLINETLDSGDAEIGEIEILRKFSFFEIDKKVASQLLNDLPGQKFEGVSLEADISNGKQGVKAKKKNYRVMPGNNGFRSGNKNKKDRWNRSGGKGRRRKY